MTFAWFYWWWDPNGLARAGLIAAGLSLVATVALGGIAWWLARRQVDIAKRQMAMEKAQFDFFQAQLAKHSKVEIVVVGMLERSLHGSGNRQVLLTLAAKNVGTKAADGFFWEVRLPEKLTEFVQFADHLWRPMQYGVIVENEMLVWIHKDFYSTKLFAGTHADVTRLLVNASAVKDCVVRWRIQGEDGPAPSDGFGEILIRPRAEGLLDVTPVN